MQLSQESYRTRWLVLVAAWSLTAWAMFAQARIVRDYLDVSAQLGQRAGQVSPTPLTHMYPAFAADAQVWVRHALALLEGNQVQLRYTTIDNAPKGREVHWNSAWAWTIAGAGKFQQLFTGEPIARSVERATLWLNGLVLLALTIAISAWTTRAAGLIPGLIVVAAMTCHDRIFEGFFPSYVDHHGLLTVSVLGLVLGAVIMGAGWWQSTGPSGLGILPDSPKKARSAAIFSALCGACGLWVSAASVIPPVAIVGVAGLLAALFNGRSAREQGAQFDPYVWRLWGRVGGAASLFFYLLEYFPSHMSFRLEPNHPFHALAWFGGGEFIATVVERYLQPATQRWRNPFQLVWPLLAIAVAPVAIVIGGTNVFVVLDPFMSKLHNDYIQEFLPLWRTLRNFDANGAFQIVAVGSLPAVLGVATLSYRRRDNSISLWFGTIAGFFFLAMSWWQSRWLLNATGIQVCLILLLLATWTISTQVLIRWIATAAVIGVIFAPGLIIRIRSSIGDVAARRVAPKDAGAALNRDIAAALRATQPEGEITLLSSPNASTGISYYGRFKTLGTLYWENSEGLKAAASILGARSEEEAKKLIRQHGVTHIALIVDENFIEQYYRLLHPGAPNEEVRKCFGLTLLMDRTVPQWLQMIPYKVPDDLSSLKAQVMLLKVNFDQSLADAVYNVALAQIAQGLLDDADRSLDLLTSQVPQANQPWLRKGELQILRRNWDAAAEFTLKGMSLAPAAERPAICIAAAGAFYNQGQHGIAARLYRTALAEKFDATIACYLAWVLATSTNDSIRNGKEALELAQAALKTDPNSAMYLNGVAAAQAELGLYAEAAVTVDRALANAQARGETSLIRDSADRVALYRSGKPLRK